jgi:hypothetical protein
LLYFCRKIKIGINIHNFNT